MRIIFGLIVATAGQSALDNAYTAAAENITQAEWIAAVNAEHATWKAAKDSYLWFPWCVVPHVKKLWRGDAGDSQTRKHAWLSAFADLRTRLMQAVIIGSTQEGWHAGLMAEMDDATLAMLDELLNGVSSQSGGFETVDHAFADAVHLEHATRTGTLDEARGRIEMKAGIREDAAKSTRAQMNDGFKKLAEQKGEM